MTNDNLGCRAVRTAVLLLVMAAVTFAAKPAAAGGGPENVAVVVNADSWASMTIANEFIHLRKIPPLNVIYLRNLPSFEKLQVEKFRQLILQPVLQALAERDLVPQIDYLIYSSDIPYTILTAGDVNSAKPLKFRSPGGRSRVATTASITGLTYLHQLVLARKPAYLKLRANFYAFQPRLAGADAPWITKPENQQRLIEMLKKQQRPWMAEQQERVAAAVKLFAAKKWAAAAETFSELADTHEKHAGILYNWACSLALAGKPDEAAGALRKAVAAGWWDAEHAREDQDLESLRPRPDFQSLLSRMKANTLFEPAPRGFRSSREWSRKVRGKKPRKRKYILSLMLGVTSGRGNSVSEVLRYLRRSAAADGTRPQGTIYFMANRDVRSKTRRWGFRPAANILKTLGVAAEVRPGIIPQNRSDVLGAVVGIAKFDWPKSGSTILPGAICEHLTSLGGVLTEGAGQTPLTEFLRHGAAGASGTVHEPMSIQQKFPTPFIQVFYASGCSLAEAFYQSVSGPYQLLIVGDPLCQPWARIPVVKLAGLKAGAEIKGGFKLWPTAIVAGGGKIGRFEVFLGGRRRAAAKPGEALEVDTRKVPDGFHELRVVAITADPIETQGRLIIPVRVNNHGRELKVTGAPATAWPWDRPLRLAAVCPGAKQISFLHNGRLLGKIEGAEGKISLDLSRAGQGTIQIQPLAVLATPEKYEAVLGRPVTVKVVPPKALPALAPIPQEDRRPGLRLTLPVGAAAPGRARAGGAPAATFGGKAKTLQGVTRKDLKGAGVKPGQAFTVAAFFLAPADDVYRFQMYTGMKLALKVDGVELKQPLPAGWKFLPVALKAGIHRLELAVSGGRNLHLDLRFGGPGARRVAAPAFFTKE